MIFLIWAPKFHWSHLNLRHWHGCATNFQNLNNIPDSFENRRNTLRSYSDRLHWYYIFYYFLDLRSIACLSRYFIVLWSLCGFHLDNNESVLRHKTSILTV